MSGRKVLIGFVMLAMFVSVSPLTVAPAAQVSAGCNREIARQEAALRQFETDARRESMDFAVDDARRAALGNLKERLAGDPTLEAAEEIKERWDEWKEYMEQARSIQEVFADLSTCLNTSGATGCLKELIERNRQSSELLNRVNEATNKWLESLADDTLTEVKDRVEKARNIMQNFTNRAGNLATGAAARGIDNCIRDFEQRAQQTQRDPVDLRSSRPPSQSNVPQPPAPRQPENTGGNSGNAGASGGGGGMGAGSIAGIAAAGAGAGVGLYYLNEYQKELKCQQYETEMESKVNAVVTAANNLALCGSNVSCANTRMAAVNTAASGVLTTAGNWCTCLGPNAASELSPTEKAEVRDALNSLRSLGVNPGSLPACFR